MSRRTLMTMRARDELRERVRRAAETNGRSVSEEIEYRLEVSVLRDQQAAALASGLLALMAQKS